MKKGLILLAALAVLSVVLLGAATPAVLAGKDAITITEERRVGDPAAAQGLVVEMQTVSGNTLHWTTTVTLGAELETRVDYQYDPVYRYEGRDWEPYLYLSLDTGGFSSGPFGEWEEALTQQEFPSLSFLKEMIAEVAADTGPGETGRAVLQAGDYWEYLPMAMGGDLSPLDIHTWEDGFWPDPGAFFQLPADGTQVEVIVERDSQGQIDQVEAWTYSPFYLTVDSCFPGEDGGYLAISLLDQEGNPVAAGRIPKGGMLLYVPLEVYENARQAPEPLTRVDVDGIRTVWSAEDDAHISRLDAMDGGKLLLCREGEGRSAATLLERPSGRVRQEVELPVGDEVYSSWVDDRTVITFTSGQRLALLELGHDGLLEKRIDADVSPARMEDLYSPVTYYDGARLVLASYLNSWDDPRVDLAVCSPQGLLYGARLIHSQWDDPAREGPCRVEGELVLR